MPEKLNLGWEEVQRYLIEGGIMQCVTIHDLLMRFPDLPWKREPGADGSGEVAYAIIGGKRGTGEVRRVFALSRACTEKHRHKGRERIVLFNGCLRDYKDVTGSPTDLYRGSTIEHVDGSVHAPRAGAWACGLYEQERGSILLESPT